MMMPVTAVERLSRVTPTCTRRGANRVSTLVEKTQGSTPQHTTAQRSTAQHTTAPHLLPDALLDRLAVLVQALQQAACEGRRGTCGMGGQNDTSGGLSRLTTRACKHSATAQGRTAGGGGVKVAHVLAQHRRNVPAPHAVHLPHTCKAWERGARRIGNQGSGGCLRRGAGAPSRPHWPPRPPACPSCPPPNYALVSVQHATWR